MKSNNKNSIVALGATLLCFGALFVSSCTAGFEGLNDPKEKASAGQLAVDNYNITSFTVQLIDQAFPEQENAYQMNYDLIGNYLGRYLTYTPPAWNGKSFATFAAPDGWARYPFRDRYPKVESPMVEIIRLASLGGANYQEDLNYNWALILRAHALLHLTDIYGPMPFGLDKSNPSTYNSQETIYKALLADLNAAIAYLKRTKPGNLSISADKVYGGDMDKWFKFANSLKLRMAVRMRFAAPDLAKQYAEEAVVDGVIENNSDNALRYYTPRGLYKTSVEWGDSRMCADLDAYMNGYKDPRLPLYFSPATKTTVRPYVGCLAGAQIGSKDVATELYSAVLTTKETPGVWMTAAEMYFCRAEGALAGWQMNGRLKDLYELAVVASFEQWGASGAEAYLASTAQPAAYVDATGGYGSGLPAPSTITPKWNDNDPTGEENFERLMVQKWIALFPNGQEAWSDMRRTGYPKVFDIQTTKNGYDLSVPNRVPFDTEEKVNNPAGYAAGVNALGGADNYATKLWWQKK